MQKGIQLKEKKQENLTDPDTNLRYRKLPSTRRENHKQQLPNRLPIFKFNTGRHVRYRTPVTLWKALRIVRPARWSCPEIKYERCSKASVTTQAARSTICCSNFTGSILRSRKKGNILLKKKNKRKHVSRSGHIADPDNTTITFLLLLISLSLILSHVFHSFSPSFTQTFSTFSQSTETIEFIVLTFLLSVSVSLFAILDVETPI